MSVKALMPNQHDYLHPFYGEDNCCLCKAEARIKELEEKVKLLEAGNGEACRYAKFEVTG